MSDYFDNESNANASWNVTDDKVEYVVDHGDHTHSLDLTSVTLEEMYENTNQVMGDAHRAASHDYKDND
ncbi:MAG: hypothetical protein IKO10_16365 [Lachnospiraceae bacterium]|nr:hypothetical protein [Lachnospiraceae bacterium]